LQPFNDLPNQYIEFVSTELRKVYPGVEINSGMALPPASLNTAKTRYRADSLIKMLASHTKESHVTIGLTTKDISTTKNKIKDWGVMGLGYCPGRACVVSSFRLNPKNKKEQLFKVAIHELGHTQGLQHCPVKTCFMRDAEGKNYLDAETEFYAKCRAHLIERGWDLK